MSKSISEYCNDEEYQERVKLLAHGILFHCDVKDYDEALKIASIKSISNSLRSNYVWFHADRIDLVYTASFVYDKYVKKYEKSCLACSNNDNCKFNHDFKNCNAEWIVEYQDFFEKIDTCGICSDLFVEMGDYVGISLEEWNKDKLSNEKWWEFIDECDKEVKNTLMNVFKKYDISYCVDTSHYE